MQCKLSRKWCFDPLHKHIAVPISGLLEDAKKAAKHDFTSGIVQFGYKSVAKRCKFQTFYLVLSGSNKTATGKTKDMFCNFKSSTTTRCRQHTK